MNRKTQKIIGSFLVVSLIAGFVTYYFWPTDGKPPEDKKHVYVEIVKRGDVKKVVNLPAHVKPIRQTTFIAYVEGILGPLKVKENEFVKQGTLITELYNEELRRNVDYKQETVRLIKVDLDRQNKLLSTQNKSKQAYEKAQKDLLDAQIQLEELRDKLKKTQFFAPYDGVVGVALAHEGDDLNRGDQILSFYDLSKFSLDIGIPESLIAKIHQGTEFTCHGQTGRLLSVQKVIDPKSRMALARAELTPNGDIPLGSFVDIQITVQEQKNVLTLPKSAVFLKKGNHFVYKVIEGKIDLAKVKVGLEGRERLEILQGVDVNDKVILRGQENLWPTRPVEAIVSDKTSKDSSDKQKQSSKPTK